MPERLKIFSNAQRVDAKRNVKLVNCLWSCLPSTLSPLWHRASWVQVLSCRKQLACGHVCKWKCYECSDGCGSCKQKVTKALICGHSQSCACLDDLAKIACKNFVKEFYYVVISVKKNALDLALLNVLWWWTKSYLVGLSKIPAISKKS